LRHAVENRISTSGRGQNDRVEISPECLFTLRRYLNPIKLNGDLPLPDPRKSSVFHSAAGKPGCAVFDWIARSAIICPRRAGNVKYLARTRV